MSTTDVSVSNISAEVCSHCGQSVGEGPRWAGKGFCCAGCLAVYQTLNSQGLEKYYEMVDQCPAHLLKRNNYDFVERPEFKEKYLYGASQGELDIFIEGAHCTACLWLLEKLPNYVPQVEAARLNLGTGTLHLNLKTGEKLSRIFEQIEAWGYRPHALSGHVERRELQNQQYKRDLYRIGVAAAGAGNVMLLSVCIYAGLAGELKSYFEFVSLLLALPVVFYSGIPLFLNSWAQLKDWRISVDLPIIIAVMTAFFVSLFGLATGGATYFDSITALVFMILLTRFWFKQAQQKHLGTSHLQLDLNIPFARRLQNGRMEEILPLEIKRGDRIRVLEGEILPVDGRVVEGHGFVDQSLLTGESVPVEMLHNSSVFMSSRLISGQVEVIATSDYSSSRIPKLLHEIENQAPKSQTIELADKVGQYFLMTVFVFVVGILAWKLPVDPRDALYRALSFIIVACPCTFASVIPIAMGLALRRASSMGIYIRNASVFEKILNLKNVFLDKTGTVTEGNFSVLSWKWEIEESRNLINRIYQAVLVSEHPVSQAIVQFLSHKNAVLVNGEAPKLEILPARGVKAQFANGDIVEIIKATAEVTEDYIPNAVEVRFNQVLVARVLLGDRIKSEAPEVVRQLQNSGYEVSLVSGDHAGTVTQVGRALGVPSQNCHGDLTLDEKAQLVARTPSTMMVGDGNNDAKALHASLIGVASFGGVETALRSSDVYLSKKSLRSLTDFVRLSLYTNKLIKRTLISSVIYNSLAGTLAIFGIIHPLLAALIMPLNALTSLAICQYGLREGRWK